MTHAVPARAFVVARGFSRAIATVAVCLSTAARVFAQPTPSEGVSFRDAIDRAIRNNPSIAIAAAGILHAEGLLKQARGATLLQINGAVTSTTLNAGVEFDGATVTPQSQLTASVSLDMPIVAAAAWARRAQAAENTQVAELSAADIRRQVALATADAYLTVVAQKRVIDSVVRARDAAKAHFDLAAALERNGTGSRLNSLRAEQQYSINTGLVDQARLTLYRAQEALGVLVVAHGPVDATEEPTFDVPPDAAAVLAPGVNIAQALLPFRTDLKLLAGEQSLAEHVLRDSSKDWWPSLDGIFTPQTVYPAQFFLPQNSWRFVLQANIPAFDGGQRTGVKVQRQSAVDQARASFAGARTSAAAEVRAAQQAVASGERVLTSARASAEQAGQVLNITNVSFRAGAATNIEVIDAERTARDADTAVAVAEDLLRRARLELLQALGRFP